MSICASGASRAKATSPASIVVDAAYIKSILPAGSEWLWDYLPWIRGLAIGNIGSFCTADPVNWTIPSVAQIYGFLTSGPIGQYEVVEKFMEDVTRAFMWYRLCECTSGATPAAPAPPSAPANLPAANPPGVVSLPTGAPCYSYSYAGVVVGSGSTFSTGGPFWKGRSGTSVAFTLKNTIASGAGRDIQFQLIWEQTYPSFSALHTDSYTVTPGFIVSPLILPVWPGSDECTIHVVGATGTGTSSGSWSADVYCGSVPGTPQTPCCPPDPVLMARVNQILDLVTLVQRQAVPFGYVPGAVHAGLTGSGVLSVSGLLGCKVDMTTIPASYGVTFGTPDEHFDLGYVTFGTPDGYPSSQRLDHQPTFFMPARCGAYSDLAYTLAPGVVATITELLREP